MNQVPHGQGKKRKRHNDGHQRQHTSVEATEAASNAEEVKEQEVQQPPVQRQEVQQQPVKRSPVVARLDLEAEKPKAKTGSVPTRRRLSATQIQWAIVIAVIAFAVIAQAF
jgi:hypothetical protein